MSFKVQSRQTGHTRVIPQTNEEIAFAVAEFLSETAAAVAAEQDIPDENSAAFALGFVASLANPILMAAINLANGGPLAGGEIIYIDADGELAVLAPSQGEQILWGDGDSIEWNAPQHAVADLAPANVGSIFYVSPTGGFTRLAPGNDGQVLTLAAGVPTWATP